MSQDWDPTPSHFNQLDLRGFLQDKEIDQVEMEDVGGENKSEAKKDIAGDGGGGDDEDEVRFLETKPTDFVVVLD